jgi:precorrin-8X/cobalt-precorrin-8 methylmutase
VARRNDLILSLSKDAGRPSPSAEPLTDETTSTPRQYLRDPDAIYRESFTIIRREANLSRLPPDIADIAVRLIHACGMIDIVADLAFTPEVAARARAALTTGASILCDSAMVAAGMMRARLPARNEIICTLDDARVPELVRALKTTRSAAAVELWAEHLAGAIVAIGNSTEARRARLPFSPFPSASSAPPNPSRR